jgi:hypothetical protein
MTFQLQNNVTKKEYSYRVYDVNDSTLFFHFTLTLGEEMDEGEYTYRLMNEEVELAKGLLQIGDYENNSKKYTVTDGNGIKQYNG